MDRRGDVQAIAREQVTQLRKPHVSAVSLPPDDLISQSIAQFHPADRLLTLVKPPLLAGLQKPRSELPLQPFALGWRVLNLARRVAMVWARAKDRHFRPAAFVLRAPPLPPSELL